MEHLLENLTDAQREAVLHHDGPLLILAGPGSGKTRVVTHRIAHMLADGVPGHQILALTFTNKAAEEMRLRVAAARPRQRRLDRHLPPLLRPHAAEVRPAGRPGRKLHYLRHRRQRRGPAAGDGPIARRCAPSPRPSRSPGPSVGPRIISSRRTSISPGPAIRWAASCSRSIRPTRPSCASSNAVDFDDLLLHVATILRENHEVRAALDERYRYILVDEYQDTNLAQYAIARALSIDYPNLAVTGDPDQSIYGWRGANLNNILDFEKDFPEVRVVRLERNYRSTKRILRVADELISHNLRRKKKALFTENEAGEPVRLVTYRNAQGRGRGRSPPRLPREIAAGRRRARDFAIFYRTNALSRSFELALRDAGVPYQMVNGVEFFQRQEIKDVLAYLQLVNNPHDEVALLRVINRPARGIGKTTIERLAHHAQHRGLSLLDAAREVRQVESDRRAVGQAGDRVRRHGRSPGRRRRADRRTARPGAQRIGLRGHAQGARAMKKTRNAWPTSRNCSPSRGSSTSGIRARATWRHSWKKRRW